MLQQLSSTTFLWEVGIAIVVCITTWLAVLIFNSTSEPISKKTEDFRVPTNNVLTVFGLLVPGMSALASYLYINNPNGEYASLLAAILVLLLILVLAVWVSFSLLPKSDCNGNITLNLPEDRKFITAMGWMYVLLLLGVIYFAIFLLCELPPSSIKKQDDGVNKTADYYVAKPSPVLKQSKDDVIKTLGQPSREDAANRKLIYDLQTSTLELSFDESQHLISINNKGEK